MSGGPTGEQLRVLAELAHELDEGTYLAGDVAVATFLRHRRSLDLDLFVPAELVPEATLERLSATVPGVREVGRARSTLHLEVAGIPVSLLQYRYPLLTPPAVVAGLAVPVASKEDLACMKLSAIAGRGAAKDFWDLDALLASGVAGGDLGRLLTLFQGKYATEDIGHVVRALSYFGEADAAPLPVGLSAEQWGAICEAWRRRVLALDP